MWFKTIQLGFKNLLLHKLRSFLTMLGVILGVASVIVMLAIGEGSKREALEQIRQLGATNVIIRSVRPKTDKQGSANAATRQQSSMVLEYGLTYKDFDRLVGAIPTIAQAVPSTLVRADAQRRFRTIPNARILGTTPAYFGGKNLLARRGRFLTTADLQANANVAVLSSGAARRLFHFNDPIGKTVLLGTGAYQVVGVLAPKGLTSRINPLDANNEIYVPLSTARRRFGELKIYRQGGVVSYERTELNEITLTVRSTELVSQTATMARTLLGQYHPAANDYELQVPLELLRQVEQEKRIWNLVLGSVASISLLVGGIGIMNIMLANVTERTREIGVRRALGAKRSDITLQFLVETGVLSSLGGLLGITLGISIPWAIRYFSDIPTIVTWWSVLLALLISLAVGIIFGIYPARRAANMEPIEALRHE